VRFAAVLALLAALIAAAVLLSQPGHDAPVAPEPEAAPEPPKRRPLKAEDGYVGSAVCGECHKDLYARWAKTGHALGLVGFSPEAVKKPFDGEIFTARDTDHRLGPGATMHCEGPGGEMRDFDVDLVVGVRRIQMFTTKLDGGRIQVLPVFLEVPKQRWFDYTDFIFGAPPDLEVPKDSANSWYSYARNFNSRCGSCHTTNYKIGYDPDKGTYETTWSEQTISCESCHGPGEVHTIKWREMDDAMEDTIVNPARLSVERSNQICGECHAEAELVVPGFRPGDDLFAFKDVHGLEDRKHVMVDGRANELIHNLVPIMQSRCGPISCTKCHDPHGRGIPGELYKPIDNDWTCTQCHDDIGANLTAHTKHKAKSTGSRCVNCHMQRMIIEGGHGWTYDHTISIPSVINTDKHGTPNACRSCHVLEDTGWEYEHFNKWYPDADKKNHRVALADTIAGRDRDKLLALSKDENPVYRAGAVWALADHDVDLREALEDPHPMVRRAAIKGVGRRHPDALVPLLDDENLVLRRRTALTLATKYDWIKERPELLERVLERLLAFAALRPDVSGNHIAIGALHELAGRKDEAIAAYERALRVNPHNDQIRAQVARLRE
jgi:predicted CXXCH cytochrome family protein